VLPATVEVNVVGTVLVKVPAVIVAVDSGVAAWSVPADEHPTSRTAMAAEIATAAPRSR
jgi:hypothetical protein